MQDAAAQRTISRDQLREQIQQTIQDARAAAQDAGGAGGMGPAAPVGIATTQHPPWFDGRGDIPVRVQETAIAFFLMLAVIFIGYPIAKALGRRIDRPGTSAKIPPEMTSQLAQLNHAVESIAIEVERISEGQRFTTKLLSGQQKLPAIDSDGR